MKALNEEAVKKAVTELFDIQPPCEWVKATNRIATTISDEYDSSYIKDLLFIQSFFIDIAYSQTEDNI